jgi:hypothetical protein
MEMRMNKRTKVAGIAAITVLALMVAAWGKGENAGTFQGSRGHLRAFCHQIMGTLLETHSKTLCTSEVRGVTYICKDRGPCTTQRWLSSES